jgi:hypothetical protein
LLMPSSIYRDGNRDFWRNDLFSHFLYPLLG